MSCKPPAPWPRPAKCRRHSKVLGMLVRRNLFDQMNQTLSLLPGCVKEENLTDLTLETDRACCQLQQIQQSFFGSF